MKVGENENLASLVEILNRYPEGPILLEVIGEIQIMLEGEGSLADVFEAVADPELVGALAVTAVENAKGGTGPMALTHDHGLTTLFAFGFISGVMFGEKRAELLNNSAAQRAELFLQERGARG